MTPERREQSGIHSQDDFDSRIYDALDALNWGIEHDADFAEIVCISLHCLLKEAPEWAEMYQGCNTIIWTILDAIQARKYETAMKTVVEYQTQLFGI